MFIIVSLGSILLYEDDVTLFSEVINNLIGPRRIIVAAAGNYGKKCIHNIKAADENFNNDIKISKKAAAMELICDEAAADFTVTLRYGSGISLDD